MIEGAGYLDLGWSGEVGEILGVWLDPALRGRRWGEHVVRAACSVLREAGVRRVRAEVYASNRVSLRTFRAAGFVEAGRFDEGVVLERGLAPWTRLRPVWPRYAALRGENLFHQHVAAAEAVADRLASRDGVDLVLGLGSVYRGFGDRDSDIDVMVLGRGPGVRDLPTGEHLVLGTSLDLFAVDLSCAPVAGWSVARRQAVGEAVVLHAAPGVAAAQLLAGAALTAGERRDALVDRVLQLGWIGYQPESWSDTRRHGYEWAVPHDVWLRRGCVASAHRTADKAQDLTFQALYLLNGEHVPDPKWRRFLAPGLPLRPSDLEARLVAAERSPRDAAGVHARAGHIRAVVAWLAARAEAEGLLAGDVYADFLATCPDYRTDR